VNSFTCDSSCESAPWPISLDCAEILRVRAPAMWCMPSRQSWRTGSRATFTRGSPQMRRSEGNKTAKMLPAMCRVQRGCEADRSSEDGSSEDRSDEDRPAESVPALGSTLREAIERLATAALAWLARILSPLLLKTGLPDAHRNFSGAGDAKSLGLSITGFGSARQRYGWIAAPTSPASSPAPSGDPLSVRTANGSPAESTLRNVRAAEEKVGEGSVPKVSAAATGNRSRSRNRRNKIPNNAGTKTGLRKFSSHDTSERQTCKGW